ncbi:hypothetical protein [Enterococcus sp. LJL51]|uniref:hypothetical protein n=1 Tax=Enterococcus sp. LJL51 TaxID=3416656 RepID=UPI003CE91BBA
MPKNTDLNAFYFQEYKDRGMLKWQGMYLSEHTAELAKEQQKEQHIIKRKPTMTETEIQEILAAAYKYQQTIAVQLDMRDTENNYFEDITGIISGFDELGLYIDTTSIPYEAIHHVEIIPFKKWSEV